MSRRMVSGDTLRKENGTVIVGNGLTVDENADVIVGGDLTADGDIVSNGNIAGENALADNFKAAYEFQLNDGSDAFGTDECGIYIKWTDVKYYVRYDIENDRLMFVSEE